MRKQTKAKKIRSKLADVLVLLIFFLPLFMSVLWLHSVFASPDKRHVFSQGELSAMHDNQYSINTEAVKPFDEPIITITFDDGWESSYSKGLPVLQKYGILSTQYVLGDGFDRPQYYSEAQIRSLQTAGHEIAAHTMSHADLTKLDEGDLEWELGQADRLLTAKFGEINDFATPFGASNQTVTDHAKPYYRSLRNTTGDPTTVGDEDINLRSSFNPYNINAYTVRSTTKNEDIQRLVDYTVQHKGWLVLTYHQIDDDGNFWSVKSKDLDTQLRMVRASGARTATIGQVLDVLYPS